MIARVSTHGRFPHLVGTHTVVLFDPATGDVHHLHHAFLFDGGATPTEATLEAVARRNASHRRRTPLPSGLQALHLRDAKIEPGPHRVDLATQRLVEVNHR
jgi:hypothetical protein